MGFYKDIIKVNLALGVPKLNGNVEIKQDINTLPESGSKTSLTKINAARNGPVKLLLFLIMFK